MKTSEKSAAKPSSQRAREKKTPPPAVEAAPPDKPKRIEAIVDLMVSGAWVTGKTAPMLAREWGLATSTVEGYSAEASRHIKGLIDPADRAEMKARYLAKLEGVLDMSLAAGRFEAAKGILELEGKALGHFEAEKHEISGNLSELLQLGTAPRGSSPD